VQGGLVLNIVKRGQNLGSINNSKSAKQYALYLLNAYQGLKVVAHLTEDKTDLKNTIHNTMVIIE
jgi:TetR/AcrR family transcriptional repressor of nem operon